MLFKTSFIVFLATLTVSFAKNDHDLARQVLSTGTNLYNEFLKAIPVAEAEKYALDFNELYDKHDFEGKTEHAKNVMLDLFKKGAEFNNVYLKDKNILAEKDLKEDIENIKELDPVLADKLQIFYEKTCDLDRITEEVIKYATDVDKISPAVRKVKTALELKLIKSIKDLETTVLGLLSKHSKGH